MDVTKLLLDHGRHDVVLAMFGVQNVSDVESTDS